MRMASRLLAATAALMALATAPGETQEKYPSRPIEMVIPTPPGGGTDISLRMLAELVEPVLGQKIVVVNKAGGSGTIGMQAIIRAKPDGHTIGGLWNAPLTISPHMLPVGYTTADYATIALATWSASVHCVKPDFAANDGKSYIEAIRQAPDKYTYGNDGVGGSNHLAVERIFSKLGVKARPVPFGGAGETLKAFLGGHVDIYVGSIAPILPYVKDKSAKCLLIMSPERNAQLPDAAGLTDLGIPDEATVLWRGIIAPKGVPADRLAILEKAFTEAAKSERFRTFMSARGEDTRGSGAADFRKLIETEHEALGKVMKAVGLAK